MIATDESNNTTQKRRGRPPGSKNKPKTDSSETKRTASEATASNEPKRRGRNPNQAVSDVTDNATQHTTTSDTPKSKTVKADTTDSAMSKTGMKKKQTRNRPDLQKFGYEYAEPGDNSRYIRQALVSIDLPPIDISDPKQVENRLRQYFEYCAAEDIKPRVSGMANWLGVHRDTLNCWKNGKDRRGQGYSEMMEKYMGLMEELWESYMLDGEVNTVAGIFLGKIMFGYKEPTEVIVSKGQPLIEQTAPEQLEEYLNTVDAD